MDIKEDNIYTWPNPHFPFLCLLNSKDVRVFFISNLTHNYKWLKNYRKYFKASDFFFVSCGWNFSKYLAKQADLTLVGRARGERFIVLAADHRIEYV